MSSLTYTERERIARFLGFKGGYVFTFLKSGYTKTNTRDIIYAATGIDIYKNTEYDMSQERCIRSSWRVPARRICVCGGLRRRSMPIVRTEKLETFIHSIMTNAWNP